MNVDNAKSQMRKGMLEYCVLLLLRRQPSYAADVITRLKEAQLIVVEGPPRKYYALTDEGCRFLEGLDAAWNELAYTVGVLKGTLLAASDDVGEELTMS